MTDDRIEELLRASRPAGPPPELRARIVAARPARPAWPWMAAAAALLALTIALQFSAARELSVIRPETAPSAGGFRDVPDLKDSFDLDDEAMQTRALRRQLERRLTGREEPVSR